MSATVDAGCRATLRIASAKSNPPARAFGGSAAVSRACRRGTRRQAASCSRRVIAFGPKPRAGMLMTRPEAFIPPVGHRAWRPGGEARGEVLDLRALIKADVTDDGVGHAAAHQRFFEEAAEAVAAIEERELTPRGACSAPAHDLLGDFARL